MNLGQATAEMLAWQRAAREGLEAGQRGRRLKVAVRESVKFLRDHPDTQDVDAEDVARELELSYAEARKG